MVGLNSTYALTNGKMVTGLVEAPDEATALRSFHLPKRTPIIALPPRPGGGGWDMESADLYLFPRPLIPAE